MRVAPMAIQVGGHGPRPISGRVPVSGVRPQAAVFQVYPPLSVLLGRGGENCRVHVPTTKVARKRTVSRRRIGAKGPAILGRRPPL